MTEPTDLAPTGPPHEPPPEPSAEPPPEPAGQPRRPLLPWLTGAGFLVVAAAFIWLWQHQGIPPPPAEPSDALARQVAALEVRAARLEQRPPPTGPDLAPLASRITALEQRPAAQPAPDLAPLAARIATLEQRQPPNLAPLESRLATLEPRLAALEDRQRTAADLARRLDAVETRLTAGEKRAAHSAQMQGAAIALAAGRPLGEVTGAPPALAQFAAEPPPTEAELRQSFPAAARQAVAAARPSVDNAPLLARLWAQAQDLVTIRQGDHVLVGDPAAGVLARARAALESGDLTAAVAAVATLQGAPAEAIAPWLARARALLDARAALAAWAASG